MKKYTLVFTALALMSLFVSSAMAFGEIRYPDRPLNLRESRSARAEWVGSLYPGQKVRVAFMKDGWVAVFEPNETRNTEAAAVGFSNAKYLLKKKTRVEPKEWGELVYTPRTLNVRTGPSIRSRKVDTLKAMEHVIIDFPDGDWTMVFAPDATVRSKMNAIGFSSAKYFQPATERSKMKAGLVKKPVEAPTVVEAQPEKAAVSNAASSSKSQHTPTVSSNRVVELTKAINIRQSRTSNSPLIRTLQPGDRVRVGLLRNGWYAVFKADELVVVESRSIGYALESLVDKGSMPYVVEDKPLIVAKPAAQPKPVPQKTSKPRPVATPPAPKPAPKAVKTTESGQQTLVIDRTAFAKTKRADPTPNKTAHGYKYRLLEKGETRQMGEPWITLKVFLATSQLPDADALKDFSTTLWKDHRKVTKKVAVLIYLPGMNTDDLSYSVAKFDDTKMLELWVRKATLFGTEFMK